MPNPDRVNEMQNIDARMASDRVNVYKLIGEVEKNRKEGAEYPEDFVKGVMKKEDPDLYKMLINLDPSKVEDLKMAELYLDAKLNVENGGGFDPNNF